MIVRGESPIIDYNAPFDQGFINNGLTSDYFTLARGVRQGDPLSPYLFLLVIETLAISIRKNPAINGIKIDNNEAKV